MKSIFEGKLRNGQNYIIRELSLEEINQIEGVQKEALNVIDSADTLQPVTHAELEYNLTDMGYMIGAFVGNKLIAFRSLLIPKFDENHIGYDLGFPEDQFEKIVYQEITIVSPDYRGHGLQKKLGEHIMKSWDRLNIGDLQYVCATVAPHNIASLKDKFNQGLGIVSLKYKYNGKLRYIFLKNLTEKVAPKFSEVKEVEIEDYQAQRVLLDDSWIGFDLRKSNNGFTVAFGKLVNR